MLFPILLSSLLTVGLLPPSEEPPQSPHESSKTFQEVWNQAAQIPRGKHASIQSHAAICLEGYQKILQGDYAWLSQKGSNLSPATFQRLQDLCTRVDEAFGDFAITLHLCRDLGWSVTQRGQGHQEASALITRVVLEEMGYGQDWILMGEEAVRYHSLAGEFYLGEVSPATFREAVVFHWPYFLQLVSVLNLMEIHAIDPEKSCLNEANVSFILNLLDGPFQDEYLKAIHQDRLRRLLRENIFQDTQAPGAIKRYDDFLEALKTFTPDDQSRIELLLRQCDFHYVASLFTRLTPETIARFFLFCTWNARPRHVLCMNQEVPERVETLLHDPSLDHEYLHLFQVTWEGNTLIWDPTAPLPHEELLLP